MKWMFNAHVLLSSPYIPKGKSSCCTLLPSVIQARSGLFNNQTTGLKYYEVHWDQYIYDGC